jgi:hypothetical protein
MYGVIVQIQRLLDQSREELVQSIKTVMPRFRKIEGLARKYFLLTGGNKVGGVYFFESAAKANEFFTSEWRQRANETWGAGPEVLPFVVPAIINGPAFAAEEAAVAA